MNGLIRNNNPHSFVVEGKIDSGKLKRIIHSKTKNKQLSIIIVHIG